MTPQIVLHTARQTGAFSCTAFVTHPAAHPLQIVVAPGDTTSQAAIWSEYLGQFLERELRILCGSPHTPCGGSRPAPPSCGFSLGPQILVLVGDGSAPLHPPAWAAPAKTLAILPETARPRAAHLLTGSLGARVASFFQHSIGEVVPDLLAAADATPERPRLFISYKRDETQGLANQLFHALAEAQFDVFLDHFRIAGGVELLNRIRQELADKTMVLALESAQFLASRWTRYEIRLAQSLRLGLFAVTVPGGVKITGLGLSRRQEVSNADFDGGRFKPDAELDGPVLDQIVRSIRTQHDRAFVERRRQIVRSMQDALLLRGVHAQHFDAAGRLFAQSRRPTPSTYAIWLASRAPELSDFHRAAGPPTSAARPVLVGLSRRMESTRRAQTDWLSATTAIPLRDESRILQVAAEIAAGTL